MKIPFTILIGIAAGLINSIAWYAFANKLGFYTIEVYVYRNYITFTLLIIGVFLSIYLKKRRDQGILEFKDALRTGLLYSVVLATFLALFNYIYYTVITPDTIDYFLSEAKKSLIEHKIPAQDIPKYLEAERTNFSSFKLIPPILFFGLISSLLAGLVMQKKRQETFGAN
ncbi:MAG: DUF4199 domain-containing protein [Bacteroidota bacterium]